MRAGRAFPGVNFPPRKMTEQHKLAERPGQECVRTADVEVTWL